MPHLKVHSQAKRHNSSQSITIFAFAFLNITNKACKCYEFTGAQSDLHYTVSTLLTQMGGG